MTPTCEICGRRLGWHGVFYCLALLGRLEFRFHTEGPAIPIRWLCPDHPHAVGSDRSAQSGPRRDPFSLRHAAQLLRHWLVRMVVLTGCVLVGVPLFMLVADGLLYPKDPDDRAGYRRVPASTGFGQVLRPAPRAQIAPDTRSQAQQRTPALQEERDRRRNQIGSAPVSEGALDDPFPVPVVRAEGRFISPRSLTPLDPGARPQGPSPHAGRADGARSRAAAPPRSAPPGPRPTVPVSRPPVQEALRPAPETAPPSPAMPADDSRYLPTERRPGGTFR